MFVFLTNSITILLYWIEVKKKKKIESKTWHCFWNYSSMSKQVSRNNKSDFHTLGIIQSRITISCVAFINRKELGVTLVKIFDIW